ncbi:MAG: hypothetical protein ACYC3L_03295 [Gemmatimonadaceae bacterium]
MISAAHPATLRDELTRRAFGIHGVSIGVCANEPTLLDRVPAILPPGWEDASPATVDAWYSIVRSPGAPGGLVRYQLFEDQALLDQGFRLGPILERLDSAVRLQVGRRAPERLFVHAGAVAWNGRAIVLPGRSGVGKTSLVAALVSAGATYYSDEYAVLDGRGLLYPFTRPLSFRQGEHRRLRRSAVSDLGGRQATEALPVALVVQARYVRGARWEPRRVTAGEGVQALLANTLAVRERPAFALSVLARAVSGAVALAGTRGEAEAVASAVLEFSDQLNHSTRGTTS